MSEVPTLTLELLRHGAATARLLSSATDYLALCGDHAPETVQLPVEHAWMRDRLQGLRYEEEGSRDKQLQAASRAMSALLARIPGLLAELAGHARAGASLVHLRLVIAGDELAILPFELADAPSGSPGSGQPLVLQSDLPVCLTRQVRRTAQRSMAWPEHTRVLFAYAEPDDVGPVPHGDHLRALSEVLGPWFLPEAAGQPRWKNRQSHLVVLRRASFADLRQLCETETFSHVHLLMHGVPLSARQKGDDTPMHFGLAFHDPREPGRHEAVDGQSLALALRGRQPGGGPAVVTLASCDSANSEAVVDGGSSVAHALHQAGVPLVVASQFPLSAAGSVELIGHFYEHLIWGADPRQALFDLRWALRVSNPHTHDWASLVAYTALPDGLDGHLARLRVRQANSAVHTSLDWADHLIQNILQDPDPEPEEWKEDLTTVLSRLHFAKGRLERTRGQEHEIFGLLASAEKREAEVLHLAANRLPAPDEASAEKLRQQSEHALEDALAHYRNAFRADLRANWAITQYLCLGEVLGQPDPRRAELWVMGRMAAENDLEKHAADRRRGEPTPERGAQDPRGGLSRGGAVARPLAWAHSTLCELYALGLVLPGAVGKPDDPEQLVSLACVHAEALAELTDAWPIDVYTTRRQLLRYRSWFIELQPALQGMLPLVDRLVDLLPAQVSIHARSHGAS